MSGVDDRIDVGVAMRLLDHDKPRPLACCPTDGEPLIATMERPKAEFHCLVCGGWFGYLSPRAVDPTPDLNRRYDQLKALFDQGVRGPAEVEDEPGLDDDDTAPAYQVWRVDCPCGHVEDVGDTLPETCPHCGRRVVESDIT